MMNITNTGLRGFPFHYFKQAIVRWPQSSMVSAFQPPEKICLSAPLGIIPVLCLKMSQILEPTSQIND